MNTAHDPLVGTPLEGLTLEDVLRNVRANNEWMQDDTAIEEEVERVSRHFQAYRAVMAGQTRPQVGREFDIPRGSLRTWKGGADPRFIRDYKTNYLPLSTKQRVDFAYLLGFTNVSRLGQLKSKTQVRRAVSDSDLRKKVFRRVKKYLGLGSVGKGEVRVLNERAARTLLYASRRLDEYIKSDEERRSFIQGFVDTLSNKLATKKGRVRYIINTADEYTAIEITRALFELGVYPLLSNNDTRLSLDNNELRKFLDLFSVKKSERDKLEHFQASKQSLDAEPYYKLRRRLRNALARGKEVNQAALAREFRIPKATFRELIPDITGTRIRKRIPYAVARYEILCDFLGVPNVHTAIEPVQRHEKWFFPIGDEVYCAPARVQQAYCAALGEEKFEAKQFQGSLDAYLRKDPLRDFDFTLDEAEQVKKIKQRGTAIYLHGERYLITNRARTKYQDSQEFERGVLSRDEIDYITGELEKQLAGEVHDVEATFHGRLIRGLKVATSKGAKRGLIYDEPEPDSQEEDIEEEPQERSEYQASKARGDLDVAGTDLNDHLAGPSDTEVVSFFSSLYSDN